MRQCFHCVGFLCSLALASSGVRAQDIPKRARGWASAGLGYGPFGCYEPHSCDNFVSGEAPGALGGFASVGTSVTERVTAALEISAWRKDQGEITNALIVVSAALFLRPLANIPLRVRTALGLSRASVGGIEDDIILNERQIGVAGSLGLAYDIHISPTLSLSPGVNYGAQAIGTSLPGYQWHGFVGLTWQAQPRHTRPEP